MFQYLLEECTFMRVVIKRSAVATSICLVFPALFFFCGLYPYFGGPYEGLGLRESLICIAIGFVTLLVCLREIFDRKPFIIIDDEGIRAIQMSMKNIPWRDMRSARLLSSSRGVSIQIEVDNPESYYGDRRGYTKIDRWLDKKLNIKAVSFDASGLDMPAKEILNLVLSKIPPTSN